MGETGFWDRQDEAQKTVARLKSVRRELEDYRAREASASSLAELLDLAEAEGDESMLAEIEREMTKVESESAALETRSLLSGEHDRMGALVNIHPGAGGTE